MKNLTLEKISIAFLLLIANAHVMALEVKQPKWVNSTTTTQVEAAGGEIGKWIAVFVAVFIGLYATYPAFLFFKGRNEEALEKAQSLVIGGVVFAILGGITFAVIKLLA